MASYCTRCGRPSDADHRRCAVDADLEPPRYCSECARRMVVQVTPAGWSARCIEHGTRSG